MDTLNVPTADTYFTKQNTGNNNNDDYDDDDVCVETLFYNYRMFQLIR